MVGRLEIGKDTAQVLTESAAAHVGRIATIVSGAVREVTREVGDWASDVFEMREAADRARGAERAGRAGRLSAVDDVDTVDDVDAFDDVDAYDDVDTYVDMDTLGDDADAVDSWDDRAARRDG